MLSVNLCLLFGSFCGTARRYLNLRQYRGLQKRPSHAVRHLFVAVIASIISYASRVSTDILTNIMQASLRCCSRIFSAAFPSHPSSLHPGIPAHAPSFSPIIPRSIWNQKTPNISISQLHPNKKSSGQQSASRCLPYYNSAPGCSAPLHFNYSSLSSGISSSKASIQLSLCHLSFSPFSLAATFCRCAWSFIMVPIGFSARSSIMW